MEIQFTPEQKDLVREAIASGRIAREEDAVKEALLLWEVRQRRRAEILAAGNRALASLKRGEGRTVTSYEEGKQLLEEVKRRGMARIAAESNSQF